MYFSFFIYILISFNLHNKYKFIKFLKINNILYILIKNSKYFFNNSSNNNQRNYGF